MVGFFIARGLIAPDFASRLLGWKHSGFSIESGTRIYDEKARESLSRYIMRSPVSLEKIEWDNETDTVTWKAPCTGPHKGKERYFDGLEFIAQLTLHIPEKGKHLVRRYGVYSSRSRGTWKDRPALSLRAAEGLNGRDENAAPAEAEAEETISVSKKASRKAWARLLARVYGIDVLYCPKCGGRMRVVAVIRDPESLRKIIACTRNRAGALLEERFRQQRHLLAGPRVRDESGLCRGFPNRRFSLAIQPTGCYTAKHEVHHMEKGVHEHGFLRQERGVAAASCRVKGTGRRWGL